MQNWDWRNHYYKPAWAKKFRRFHLNGKNAGHGGHDCHPCNSRKLKIGGLWSRLAWAKTRSYLQNDHSTKGWKCGSSNRGHTYQVQSPEFKYQCLPKKRKRTGLDLSSLPAFRITLLQM
jgi:hypothetical protein